MRLPRAVCPGCKKDVAVRNMGELREHRLEGGKLCWAVGKTVSYAAALARERQERGARGAPVASDGALPPGWVVAPDEGRCTVCGSECFTIDTKKRCRHVDCEPAPKPRARRNTDDLVKVLALTTAKSLGDLVREDLERATGNLLVLEAPGAPATSRDHLPGEGSMPAGRPRKFDARKQMIARVTPELEERCKRAAELSQLPTFNAWLCKVLVEACERSERKAGA